METFWYMALVKSSYYMSIILLVLFSLSFFVMFTDKEEDRVKNHKRFYRWIISMAIVLFLYFWSSPQMP